MSPTKLSSQSLNTLKNYRAGRKLEKAVITFISSQLTTIDETYELKKLFNNFDENGDGKLSHAELKNGYASMSMDIEDIDALINEIDVDRSGFIDYTEFIAATINKNKILSKDRLEVAFNAFDSDGSGKIGIEELKQMLERDGKLADDSEWIKVI
jgi:calcium-dependent protein kinase